MRLAAARHSCYTETHVATTPARTGLLGAGDGRAFVKIRRAPHAWNLSPARAIEVQRRLAARVRARAPRRTIRTVAGVDCAFTADASRCLAAVVLWDLEARRVLEMRWASRPLRFPYVPGLLSFREAPAVLAALRALRRTPDALMCDGHGVAHPRRFGIACHLGLLCDLPTLGVAKSRLIGEHREPGRERGARASLTDGGERIGTVLRTRVDVKPVYVSVGHLLDLPSAERLALSAAQGFRLPEPTRRADRAVAALKRTLLSRTTPPAAATAR
jgi:deoxyribonuclease V